MATAPDIARPWDYLSGVSRCETCEGRGKVHSFRRATTWDPYPEVDCPDCDGEHEPECEVCGCEIIVSGYDCIACNIVSDLPAADLNPASIDRFVAAIKAAAAARRSA